MAGYGRLLREARERQRLSLEEVEAATKIRLRHLTALEAEDTAALPDPIYARGFLRIYARFLGLEPERLLALYPQTPVSDLPPPPRPTPREIPGSALFGLVLALLLLASLIIYLSQRGEGNPAEGVGVTIEIPSTTPSLAPTGVSGAAGATSTASPARPSPTRTATPAATATATNTPVPRVSLPNLIGITYSEAVSRLENLGLKAAKAEEWKADVAKDLVYRQEPAPGQSLERGSVVRLWVSLGSQGQQSVVVPDVVAKPEAEARQLLIAAGLNPSPYANRQRLEELPEGEQQRHRNTCVGCILSTTPPGGAQVAPGTVVYLAVRA